MPHLGKDDQPSSYITRRAVRFKLLMTVETSKKWRTRLQSKEPGFKARLLELALSALDDTLSPSLNRVDKLLSDAYLDLDSLYQDPDRQKERESAWKNQHALDKILKFLDSEARIACTPSN